MVLKNDLIAINFPLSNIHHHKSWKLFYQMLEIIIKCFSLSFFTAVERDVRFTGMLCTVGDGVVMYSLTRQQDVVMTSLSVGQEGHCFSVVSLSLHKI